MKAMPPWFVLKGEKKVRKNRLLGDSVDLRGVLVSPAATSMLGSSIFDGGEGGGGEISRKIQPAESANLTSNGCE